MCVLNLTLMQAYAQTNNAAPASPADQLQDKIKSFLEPERGLNNEIRAGLTRLEQTCAYTVNPKPATPPASSAKNSAVVKEIEEARKLANEQQALADKAIAEFRSAQALNTNSCAVLPTMLRVTEQCTRYQKNVEIAQAVSRASQDYFAETLARFKSYEAAVELEAKGCTRPDFARKLWAAEQAYIVPKLKSSGQHVADLLK